MKQSEFNYEVSFGINQIGIFNTYKNSLVILDNEELSHLHDLSLATEDEIKEFKATNLIIDDDIDERKLAEEDTIKYANDDRVIIRLLTTLDCQADCIYCYEKRNKESMTTETADKVVDFITNLGKESIHIEWFGGEPLYNKDIISYICMKLYERGIDFTSSMASNAILATPDVVEEFQLWKLNKVQITLDGVAEVYESIKRVPAGTFDTVISNIRNIVDHKIDVVIRLNYTNSNIEQLKDLIEYMAEIFGYNEYIHYYAYPIFQLCNDNKEFDANIVNNIFDLQDYIIYEGLATSKQIYNIKYKGMSCFATHKNGYTIGPDGTLYGCSHTTDRPMGDVVSGESIERKVYRATVPEKCKTCILYPVCKGGCKTGELGYEKINQCNLYKNSFDKFIRRMIYNKLNEAESRKENL